MTFSRTNGLCRHSTDSHRTEAPDDLHTWRQTEIVSTDTSCSLTIWQTSWVSEAILIRCFAEIRTRPKTIITKQA